MKFARTGNKKDELWDKMLDRYYAAGLFSELILSYNIYLLQGRAATLRGRKPKLSSTGGIGNIT